MPCMAYVEDVVGSQVMREALALELVQVQGGYGICGIVRVSDVAGRNLQGRMRFVHVVVSL